MHSVSKLLKPSPTGDYFLIHPPLPTMLLLFPGSILFSRPSSLPLLRRLFSTSLWLFSHAALPAPCSESLHKGILLSSSFRQTFFCQGCPSWPRAETPFSWPSSPTQFYLPACSAGTRLVNFLRSTPIPSSSDVA